MIVRAARIAVPFMLAVAGCAHVAPVEAVVSLPPPLPTVGPSTTTSHCTIHGNGELVGDDSGVDFDLFRSPASATPALRIAMTSVIAVTWSEIPAARSPTRARVEIGGQKLIRAHAYADLVGRGFQLRRRGYQVTDHVWIDGGVTVELLGAENDRLLVRRRSGLTEPIFFEARVPCGDVAYEPEPLEVPPEAEVATSDSVHAPGRVLHLSTGPGIASFLTVNTRDALALDVVERRSGSVRILFGGDGVGFDAWVPANEVEVLRYGYGSGGGSSSCGGSGHRSRQVTVKTESAVLIGAKHELLDDAVFEVGALMEITYETDDLYQVQFPQHEIDAPDGMWISKRAVEN